MKKNKNVARRLVLFASLLLSLTICFVAQIEAQGTNKTTDSQGYSLVPFDFNSTTIDPNFKGHNIVDLFKAVDKLTNLKKEEFETTPEFKQRVLETQTKASKTIDYGALKMGDYVAFTLKSKNDANSTASQLSNVSFSYDADYQTLKITCYDNDSLNNRLVFLSIKGYGIFFEKKERQSNLPCVFVTGLSPEYAKEKLDDLAVCCVGQLFYYVKSELRNNHLLPSQATSSTTIPLANVEFWLYNKKTGEELVKFTSLDFESQTTRYLGDTTLDNPAKFYRMIKREPGRSSVEKRQQATENVSTISKS